MSSRSLFTQSALSLLGTGLGAGFSALFVALGARWLGPAGYGQVGATVALANLFFLVLNPLEAGITLEVAQASGAGKLDMLRHAARRTLRGLSVGAVLGWLAWSGLVALIGEQLALGPRDALLWLGAFCAAALVACGPRGALRGRERFLHLTLNVAFEGMVRLGLGLALIAHGGGPPAMVAGYALGMLAAIAHGHWLAWRGLPLGGALPWTLAALRDDALRPGRLLSAPLVGLHVYMVSVSNIDLLTATRTLAPEEAGLYAGSASVARLVAMVVQPVLLVLFSRLATEHAAGTDTSRTLRLGALVVVGGLAGSLLVPLLGGAFILGSYLGAAYVAAQPLLVYQWATVSMLTLQVFAAESMLATTGLRGGWVFGVPAVALCAALALWHGDALQIARITLAVTGVLGSAACAVLWWATRGRSGSTAPDRNARPADADD